MLDDSMADLDAEVGLDPTDDVPTEIPPGDLDLANRILRRYRRLERDAEGIANLCAVEVRRITAWRDRRTAGIQREMERLEGLLGEFMRAVKARSYGKVKSLQLPNGTLKLQAPSSRPRVEVVEPGAFRVWAHQNAPDLLLPPKPPEADRSALAKISQLVPTEDSPRPDGTIAYVPYVDGEQVPGVLLLRDTVDRFRVSPPADEPEGEEL